ncbi:DUF262 domain-containing protein [Providencia zhijiangensis]|uniref:DUF262 domain-containing protein n=1 Tax=Providencia zhijiangensis TaxID=3053982 RepID=A0ABZ0N705_9GAMM|nr:DUF262 domain-containing protein [Providencia sp. D4759]WPA93707.1 DUF262 domain-containing protein [Providencia sp. D4759]
MNNDLDLDLGLDDSEENDYSIGTFSLVTTPNDFNISTIINFMDKGVFVIPPFQRNYVWDIAKASKLIESLIIGLPIPQIFLYEKERNKFYIIDGQQRLLSLYFFYKGKFPKNAEARNKIKETVTEGNNSFISSNLLNNDDYFNNFSLKLNSIKNPRENPLHGKNFSTLDSELRTELELATIRNMVIKPKYPDEDSRHLAMFEIFNRLNSGGVNLSNQEIRMSLYSSTFIINTINMNRDIAWRNLLKKPTPDLRLKDVEIILRLFSMLVGGTPFYAEYQKIKPENSPIYQGSIVALLNSFADFAIKLNNDAIQEFNLVWKRFLASLENIEPHMLSNSKNIENEALKLSIPVLEAIFYAVSKSYILNKDENKITKDFLFELKNNTDFLTHCLDKTTSKSSVLGRLSIADKVYGDFYDK